jgi:transcriptional regulator with XRE-family HTH domain
MPTRLNSYGIRKEAQEKLAYARVYLLGSETVSSDTEDATQVKTSQRELAKRLGVSQAEVSRLLHGECAPHPKTLEKIYELYFQARCLNWGTADFFPICALAERDHLHAYRHDLPEIMMKLLRTTLNEEPLQPLRQKAQRDAIQIDLHIRAVKLPSSLW